MSADRRYEQSDNSHESDHRERQSPFLPPLPDYEDPAALAEFFRGEGKQPGRLARMGELKKRLDNDALTDADRTEALALVAQLRHAITSCPEGIVLPFEPRISREQILTQLGKDTRHLRVQYLEATATDADFTAEGESPVLLKLTQNGKELRRIGEKSSNRRVFESADGNHVIKVSDIPKVAWQELIATDDVPEELQHLLEIPTRHGSFRVGKRTYYFEVMQKLDARGIVNRDVESFAMQLEPYLGSGEMKYAGQWGRRADGSLAIFDYLNWKEADTWRRSESGTIPEATMSIPEEVRNLYRKVMQREFSDILIQRDFETGVDGETLYMLTKTVERHYPPNRAAAAEVLYQKALSAQQSGDWVQMQGVLDTLDPAWRGGDLYYRTAAEVKRLVDFGATPGPQEMERVMRETIVPILNHRGLDPENEFVKSDARSWQEDFGEKKPDEIVAEVRRLLEKANKH